MIMMIMVIMMTINKYTKRTAFGLMAVLLVKEM